MSNDETYNEELSKAQAHIYKNKYGEALGILSGILENAPEHIDALYMSAVCERYIGNYKAAFSILDRLLEVAPEFGRAFQEEGHLHRTQGHKRNALAAYQKATQANPGLEASWRFQAQILNELGRGQEAVLAQSQAERLKTLPRELFAVTNLIHEGKLVKAENLCKTYLQKNKQDVEGIRLLGDIASRLNAMEEAEFLLESALEFAPANIQVRLDYMQLLRKRQKFEAALVQAEYLNEQNPDNPIFQSHLAIESMQTGDYQSALKLFETVLEKLPNDPATLTSKGHALKTYGEQEQAVASYQKAYNVKPDHGDAFYGLANLKTYEFTDTEVDKMESQVDSKGLTLQNRVYFCFSLAKAFEDRKQFEKAFQYYERGNELKRLQSRYKSDRMTEDLEGQIGYCTEELFSKRRGTGHIANDPIFIVGLPRAGSTLLEQILASHSQIDGTLELPNILAFSQKLRGRMTADKTSAYPGNLHDLPDEKLRALGQQYIDETRIHRQDAPFFIDKMPNNFRHIGLIHLILPNARIIDARRHPMACCFSGFKQLFAEGQEFTYGLEQVGMYYRDYVNLMDHWDKVLPGKVLRVQYEDVVADLETQVRRILDYLELPFEQGCVNYHKTERSVRTASSEQVRQPIFKSGLEQWRYFEPWLDPLKTALGPVLERYPIS